MAGSNTITMTAEGLAAYLQAIPNTRSVLVRGTHGIGKSEIIRQFAEGKGLPFIDIRLGQVEVGDLLGMPYVEDGITKHAVPNILKPVFETPVVLLFDELNRGTKDVQQSVFQGIHDRAWLDKKFHPGCYVFAAVNDDLDIYTVTEIDPALLSRFGVVDFAPTVPEWLKWAETNNKLAEEIIHVLKQHKELADPPDAKNVNWDEVQPTRRGWVMFNEMYMLHRDKVSMDVMRDWAATFVGKKAAMTFSQVAVDFLKVKKAHSNNMVQADEVGNLLIQKFFTESTWKPGSVKSIIERMDLQQAQNASQALEKHINANVKQSSTQFKEKMDVIAEAMPKEVFTKLFKSLNQNLRKALYENNKSLYQPFYD